MSLLSSRAAQSEGSQDSYDGEFRPDSNTSDQYEEDGEGLHSSRRDQKRPAAPSYFGDLHAPPPDTGRSGSGWAKPSATTSDFTKRKNWATNIVEELADFLHVLGPAGNVVFASPSISAIAGYKPEDLVGRQLDAFIHHDDVDPFNRDLRQSVSTGLPLRLHYRLRKKDNRYVILEILGHAYFASGTTVPSAEDCKCVFVMGRPYPSRQAEEVDSFLELKLENEKLRKELEHMRHEVENDPEARAALQRLKQAPRQDLLEHQRDEMLSNRYTGRWSISSEAGRGMPSHSAPKMVNGDAAGRRRKKQRLEEGEFVCRDCGTIDSPEWRKGPLGPKTLCNACGLRWAKKSKQTQSSK